MKPYMKFIGSKEWPSTPGLLQAINAGIVVSDDHGIWIENERRGEARKHSFVHGTLIEDPSVDEDHGLAMRSFEMDWRHV